MRLLKVITVEDFYDQQTANQIATVIENLPMVENEYGQEPENFNMVSDDASEMFSEGLNKNVTVIEEQSGLFRIPKIFIHFESFEYPQDWAFAAALRPTTFNIFEHKSGVKTALQEYKFDYKNLFEWDLTVNYQLSPGQAVFFRPWLFHSFHSGLIQTFRLKEV